MKQKVEGESTCSQHPFGKVAETLQEGGTIFPSEVPIQIENLLTSLLRIDRVIARGRFQNEAFARGRGSWNSRNERTPF